MFTPSWGSFPFLTSIFQVGWNHQLVIEHTHIPDKDWRTCSISSCIFFRSPLSPPPFATDNDHFLRLGFLERRFWTFPFPKQVNGDHSFFNAKNKGLWRLGRLRAEHKQGPWQFCLFNMAFLNYLCSIFRWIATTSQQYHKTTPTPTKPFKSHVTLLKFNSKKAPEKLPSKKVQKIQVPFPPFCKDHC